MTISSLLEGFFCVDESSWVCSLVTVVSVTSKGIFPSGVIRSRDSVFVGSVVAPCA